MWRSVLHSHPLPWLPWGVVLSLALWAAVRESQGRRVDSQALLGLLGLGLAAGWWAGESAGALEAAFAAAALALPYLLASLATRRGLRDAALMGVIGSWLGLQAGALALLSVSLAGVLYALGFAAHRRRLAVALADTTGVARVVVWSVLDAGGGRRIGTPGRFGAPAEELGRGPAAALPYGQAVFAGVLIAALGSLLS